MKQLAATNLRLPALMLASMLTAAPAFADKPSWAGKPEKQEQQGGSSSPETGAPRDKGAKGDDSHFGDRQRTAIHDYYTAQFRKGKCPRGLAKKRNGCMPPGQAKKWAMGQPLPSDVVMYDLPAGLVSRLGPPPEGHRYVRVASDILMIAIGTSMVVDAIEDLGRM